jgi:hypothetical protein
MDSISSENVNQVVEALMRSKTSKAIRKFEDFENLVKNFKGDNVTKDFVHVLIDRNQKIVRCLNHVIHLLPIPPTIDCSQGIPSSPKSKRRLFILSDDLQKTVASPNMSHMSKVGTITIQSDGAAAQTSSVTFGSQTVTHHRRFVNGILQDDVSSMEVMLELKEPASDSINFIDFSSTMNRLSASLAMNGEELENIEVYEISITETPNNVIAVVENERTGEHEEVSVQIVPTEPNNDCHGRIVEIKPAEEDQGTKTNFIIYFEI